MATPLWVRCSTSRVSAIWVSHVPIWEISCPTKKSRKFLTASDRNVVRTAVVIRPLTGGILPRTFRFANEMEVTGCGWSERLRGHHRATADVGPLELLLFVFAISVCTGRFRGARA